MLPPAGQPTQTYAYNQRNLLTANWVDNGGGYQLQAAFVYDGEGRRLQQIDYTGNTTTTITYTNDLAHDPVPVLVVDDGTSHVTNLFGLGLLAQVIPTQTRYLLVDGLGSVRSELVSGTVESIVTRDPHGQLLQRMGERGTSYGFTGELEDSSTGLLYLRARYYNPKLQQFMSRDPFPGWQDSPASQHPYTYVHNNPILFTDPSGESIMALVVGGAVIAGVTGISYDLFIHQGFGLADILDGTIWCQANWLQTLAVGGVAAAGGWWPLQR